jgi:LacI family transcriptional regulator
VPEQGTKRKRATLRELSEITGLSTAGVSYALRGQRVSPETERRVRDAAERIGFRSDPIARALRGGRTELVGVVGGSLDDLWHQQFVAALQPALRSHGLRMVLADAGGDPGAELDVAADLADRRVDGLIVLPLAPATPGWRSIAAGTPTVSVNASLPDAAGSIRFDSARGIELALGHLRDRGHERVIVLGGGPHAVPRRAGVRRVRCGPSAAAACAAATALLERDPSRTAVFCLSDTIACGVYEACAQLGRSIPRDLSVVGFDDIPVAQLLRPALTAVGWDTPRAAVAAAEMLAGVIGGRAATDVVIEPGLRVRRSTATIARR